MSSATLVSVEEYLATTYHPDCDFVDGEVRERNLGTKDHSNLQGEVRAWFRQRRRELRLKAFTELRIRVAPRRYRIPDDTFPRLQERLDDYLAMGVPNIWVLDPASR